MIFPTQDQTAWSGLRKFRVKWKVSECDNCHSFYLVPHDGQPLPPFKPGQFLTLSAKLPGSSRATIRCYSLSDAPRQDYYRISVKKVAAFQDKPEGVFSTFMNDIVAEGDILDIKSPSGSFYLETESDRPVVLLAAGIGITPVLSMLSYLLKSQPQREVYFFMAARNSKEHPFKKQLETLAAKTSSLHLRTIYSDAQVEDKLGSDFDIQGQLNIGHLRDILPSSNFEYYLCGPPPFMAAISEGLRNWGVAEDFIRSEAFGPASIKVNKPKKSSATTLEKSNAHVTFTRTSKTCDWSGEAETLLDLAEAHQIEIDSGCRAGNCGTCVTAIKSGKVIHSTNPGCEIEEGTCLPCIATPDGDITLDA